MNLATRVMELNESTTLAVTAKAAKMQAEGIDVVSFAAGEPDFDTPPHIVRAAVEALEQGHTRYPKPASGIAIAKKAVCQKLARENDLKYKPEQVIITNGGKLAIYLAIHALVNPGDEVVIPLPYWVSYPEMVGLAGGRPVFVAGPESKDYKLTPDALCSVLTDRTKLFLLTSPSNPSGVTYTPDEIRALAGVLQPRDVWVMSDEIYDRLLFDGHETLSYAAVGERAYRQTLTVNSVSKTYAMTGWRLGYAAGPVELIDAMAKIQSQSTSGAPTFAQYALAAALTDDQTPVEQMRAEFERRAHHMYKRLCAMPALRCPKPTGAFYCFPNVSGAFARLGVKGSVAVAEKLLETALVAVVPGAAFGLDDHIRLSFATSMEMIDKGLDRIEALLR